MASAQGSLNMKPGADHCGPGEVCRRLLPRQDRISLGAAADRIPPLGAGPNAITKVEPVNDRPSPRSVLIQMSTQLVVSNHLVGFRRQTAAAGPLPFKAKEVVLMQTKHETVLRRALRAPELMLDDIV